MALTERQLQVFLRDMDEKDAHRIFYHVAELLAKWTAKDELKYKDGFEYWDDNMFDLVARHINYDIGQLFRNCVLANMWTMDWIHKQTMKEAAKPKR